MLLLLQGSLGAALSNTVLRHPVSNVILKAASLSHYFFSLFSHISEAEKQLWEPQDMQKQLPCPDQNTKTSYKATMQHGASLAGYMSMKNEYP